ncbi:ribulose-phosphate 3-epimerase [candidate division WOR-3 bacterium]|nr:ribulose-phosphate 3-epimerase [candidate division WOR-3 bacterium]
MIRVGASLISSDLLDLGNVIKNLETSGVDFFHFDVMDGHFVPNLTFGPDLACQIKNFTDLPLDVHLMTDRPEETAQWFLRCHPDYISWHVEIEAAHERISSMLRKNSIRPGMAINPGTPVDKIFPFLHLLDFVLIMSVNPGFGGQKFIDKAAEKALEITKKKRIELFIDGGINDKTAPIAKKFGIENLVSGSYLVKSADISQSLEKLKSC